MVDESFIYVPPLNRSRTDLAELSTRMLSAIYNCYPARFQNQTKSRIDKLWGNRKRDFTSFIFPFWSNVLSPSISILSLFLPLNPDETFFCSSSSSSRSSPSLLFTVEYIYCVLWRFSRKHTCSSVGRLVLFCLELFHKFLCVLFTYIYF